MTDRNLSLRPATPADVPFVLDLTPRFAEFGLPQWRDTDAFLRTVRDTLRRAFEEPGEAEVLLIAELDGRPAGFVHLTEARDVFSGQPYGYVSDVAVAPHGEGRGVGRALMHAAEDWARACGYPTLALTVFGRNGRARRLYEQLGYEEDTLRLFRVL